MKGQSRCPGPTAVIEWRYKRGRGASGDARSAETALSGGGRAPDLYTWDTKPPPRRTGCGLLQGWDSGRIYGPDGDWLRGKWHVDRPLSNLLNEPLRAVVGEKTA